MEHTFLKTLILSCNLIGAKGAIAIAEALRVNSTLEDLDLSLCDIDDTAIIIFGDALKANMCLKKLNLGWNPFSIQVAIELAKSLEKNRSLTEIVFPAKIISCRQAITEILGANDELVGIRAENHEILSSGATWLRKQNWADVRRDGISFNQLCEKYLSDCGGEVWRFARALFRARKDGGYYDY